jgi:hypothetical protein
MAIPTSDEALANWSTNANTRLVADGVTVYLLTAGQVSGYTPLHDSFVASFNTYKAARDAGTRSESLTAQKDDDKRSLLVYARAIYGAVQINPAVSDADKILLGVHVKDVEPSPSTLPAVPPTLTIASVVGRTVNVVLRDPTFPDRRALPIGATGAFVMTHLGETAPTNPFSYSLQGATGRTSATVILPNDVAPGTKIWLSAVWLGKRKQMGTACTPISTYVGDPSMTMAS